MGRAKGGRGGGGGVKSGGKGGDKGGGNRNNNRKRKHDGGHDDNDGGGGGGKGMGKGKGKGKGKAGNGKGKGKSKGKKGKEEGDNLCRSFANGNCDYGEECRFSHDASDGWALIEGSPSILALLGKMACRKLTFVYRASGGGGGQQTKSMCYAFRDNGSCDRGVACRFSHSSYSRGEKGAQAHGDEEEDESKEEQGGKEDQEEVAGVGADQIVVHTNVTQASNGHLFLCLCATFGTASNRPCGVGLFLRSCSRRPASCRAS